MGGEGKIIEIDECFLTKQKYGVWIIPVKAQTIVFGMIERDDDSVRVDDPALYHYLMSKEWHKKKLEVKKAKKSIRQPQ